MNKKPARQTASVLLLFPNQNQQHMKTETRLQHPRSCCCDKVYCKNQQQLHSENARESKVEEGVSELPPSSSEILFSAQPATKLNC